MNYTEFIGAVTLEVKKALGPGVIVEQHTAVKNNGTVRKGLMIARQGVNISPAIYLEEFYEQYQGGKNIPELADIIRQIYERVKVQNSYPCENIFSYEKIKHKIVYKLIQKDSNKDLLENVPFIPYLDLAIVFYVILETSEFGTATLLVKKEHLKEWGITKEEVEERAKVNTPKLLPLKIEKLSEFMYVMTNQAQNHGACALCYPNACKNAREKIGENYFVIPSSIHEMILVPESYGLSRTQLKTLAKEINATEVEREEVLSDNIYYYSGEEDRLIG